MRYDTVQRAVSAVSLPEDTILSLRASSDSTVPLEFINYETDYGPRGLGELVCHVRGDWDDLDSAAVALTNSGRRNLQVLAVAANAAILEPHLQVAYEPRPGGRFLALRTLGSDPQVARRELDVDRTFEFLSALQKHPKEARLLRAVENYGEALRRSHSASSVRAVMHLWIAVENLTVVVANRVKDEHRVRDLSELGVVLGLQPRPGAERVEARHVSGVLRRREIFHGDEDTHRALRAASDGVEHGYLSFGDARELVEGLFDRAAMHVRRSILCESGLSAGDVDALTGGIYVRPLPLWRPQVVAEGTFDEDTAYGFSRPAEIRVDASMRLEGIESARHATTMTLVPKVQSFDGLALTVDRFELDTPGQLQLRPEDS